MRQVDKLTDSPRQSLTLVGEKKEQIPFTLVYMPRQQLWRFDIAYGDFVANGVQLVVSPNILRQFKNKLPFGLACGSVDGLDPYYIDDFKTSRISLYLLNASEVAAQEAAYFE